MLVVGLTGGIASGKSEVSRRFAELGVPIIDADLIARDLTLHDPEVLAAIRARLGDAYFDASGRLDRAALRRRVFGVPEDLRFLETLLHPRVAVSIQTQIETHRQAGVVPYCLVVAPLLLEADLRYLVDRLLVVDVPETTQLERTLARDHCAEETVRAIMARQLPRAERIAQADDRLDNGGDLIALQNQVTALDRRYRALADT